MSKKQIAWAAVILATVIMGLWTAWQRKAVSPPPRLPEKPLMAAAFPAATPAAVRRITDPAQLQRLSLALGAAEPLDHRRLPAREPDDEICIFAEGSPNSGPCLRLWKQENLLQSPAGLYTPPPDFGELLDDLRAQGSD